MQSRPHRPGGAYARPPVLPDEPQRMEALLSYEVLDTPPEPAFDDLAVLAAYICGTPSAMVSLVDHDRQWFKSRVGIKATETPRDVAFCAHAIAVSDAMVVPDARADERFAENPLVTDAPHIRFYAGAPLRTRAGHALGTLCVVDQVPHDLDREQIAALEALSRQAVAQLELRRQLAEVKRLNGMLPYCSRCGKLRTDLGDICPDCAVR